ncbi:MAG: VOC family protein [Schleiferiaceae bacterium]|jgi:catechol 2,3-dioxygenase-like lactoylglutathione lyase family enzyme|nr:VOC family protein [Schleiferiaceae bacterium]
MNLNQITIPTKDMRRSVEFYQKMGHLLIVDSIPRYARFECRDGDSTFSLHHVDQLNSGESIVIYFECDNLDIEVKRLKNLGVSFDLNPTDQDWLWREARLEDPDGNKIILYHAGENRKNPPWRIATE